MYTFSSFNENMEELDFREFPKWMPNSLEIMALVDVWAKAHEVSRGAIIRQISIAYAWTQANPKKAPKRLIARFLHSWMAQAKRYGNLKVKAEPWKPSAPEPECEMTIEEMRAIRRKNMPQYKGDPQKYPGAIETEAVKNVA